MKMEKYLQMSSSERVSILQRKCKYRKKVWVVGNTQFPFVNSSVVTLVHVMHRETSWPASRDRMKRLVHKLLKRHHELRKKAPTEE